MTRQSVFVAALVLLLQSILVGNDATQREWEKLNGAWQLVSDVYDGKVATAKDIADYRMELDTGKLTAYLGDSTLKTASKAIDPSAKPKTMLETQTDKRQVKGIYELEGDTLTICSLIPWSEFRRPEQKRMLWVFRYVVTDVGEPVLATLYLPHWTFAQANLTMAAAEEPREG